MRALRAITVFCVVVLSGCAAYPRLTSEHVVQCVPMTFAYRNVTREAGAVRVEVDEGDLDFIDLHVIGAAGRVGFFRVWRGDRRIEMWDWQRVEWVAVGVCD